MTSNEVRAGSIDSSCTCAPSVPPSDLHAARIVLCPAIRASEIHTSMSRFACSDSPPPEPQPEIIQDSDSLVSRILRGSQPLLESDRALINNEIAMLEQLGPGDNPQLQTALEHRKSIYAPIRRLPHDILLEIFHSAYDSWWGVDRYRLEIGKAHNSLNMNGPLWVLARVCGLWRDTLHASPGSWAQRVLVQTPFSKHALEKLHAYLERTGEHLLSVMVISYSTNSAVDGEILSLLVQSRHRWRNACVRIHARHMHHLESASFPVLETIEMNIFDGGGAVSGVSSGVSSGVCLNAPRLCQASFLHLGIPQFRLPSTITHYSGHITCVEDLRLLGRLPELRTCHLQCRDAPLTATPPVLMAELRQLYVELPATLDSITAPMLQSLTIIKARQGSSLSAFLRRSGCRLRSLGMCPSTSMSDVLSLEACSAISHLKLEFRSNRDRVPECLAHSSVLPDLRHLTLCFWTFDASALDMIRARGHLETIEISFGRHISTSRDIEAGIRSVIGDNVWMHVENWSPLYRDYRDLFSGPELPEY